MFESNRSADPRGYAVDRAARTVVLILITALLPTMAALTARSDAFEHDEIYTILISKLPSVSTIWQAEREGIDSAPPLNELLTRGAHAVFGVGPIATRLPAIAGYWLASVIVFLMVARRSNTVSGISAVILLFYTLGFRYAFEARGYGVMLGLFALALYPWSEAARGRRRAVMVPLLAIALTASLWNHYYAILTFIPLAVGEAVRTLRTRRWDWAMAAALILPLATLLPLIPHMRAVAAEAPTYWERASIAQVLPAYRDLNQFLFGRRFLITYLAAMTLPLLDLATRRRTAPSDAERLPMHEVAAGVATLLIPVGGVLLGLGVTGVFTARYALSFVLGVGLVVPLALWRISAPRAIPALLLCLGLTASFARSAYGVITTSESTLENPVDVRPQLVAHLRGNLPVVVTGLFYLQAWYYAPPETRGNLLTLVDPDAAVKFSGTDSIDRDFMTLRRWAPVDVRDYAGFAGTPRTFIVYVLPNNDRSMGEWLLPQLRADAADIEQIGWEWGATIYSVSLRPAQITAR